MQVLSRPVLHPGRFAERLYTEQDRGQWFPDLLWVHVEHLQAASQDKRERLNGDFPDLIVGLLEDAFALAGGAIVLALGVRG